MQFAMKLASYCLAVNIVIALFNQPCPAQQSAEAANGNADTSTSNGVSSIIIAPEEAERLQKYWTPERMRNARPMPLPTVDGLPGRNLQQSPVTKGQGEPGFSPGSPSADGAPRAKTPPTEGGKSATVRKNAQPKVIPDNPNAAGGIKMDQDHRHLMDGKTILYTYSGGLRFQVRFANGKASYKAIGDSGSVSSQNSDIPYSSRLIRPNLIHTVWHEAAIGDMVSLIIDLDAMKIYSAALIGYREADPMLHFEDGVIEKITSAN